MLKKLGFGPLLHVHMFFSVGDRSSAIVAENNPGRGDEMEVLPSMEEDLGRLSPIKSKFAFICMYMKSFVNHVWYFERQV